MELEGGFDVVGDRHPGKRSFSSVLVLVFLEFISCYTPSLSLIRLLASIAGYAVRDKVMVSDGLPGSFVPPLLL